jgi:FkbM family methyltransferase
MIAYLCRHSWRLYQHISAVVNAAGVKIPLREGIGLRHVDQETPHMLALGHVLPARSGAVVDIGANIGGILVSMLKLGFRDRQYIGFEPQIQAASYIQRLIAANGLHESASVLPIGLSDHPGSTRILQGEEADSAATIMTELRPASFYKHSATIPLSTGDEQLADVEAIAFLKIDVEGAEHLVLRGLRKTIERCRPAIVIEILPYQALLDGTYPRSFLGELTPQQRHEMADFRLHYAREVERELRLHGYKFLRIRREGMVEVASLDRAGQPDGDNDFLAVSTSAAERVSR